MRAGGVHAAPAVRVASTALKAYAVLATSASLGAVRDVEQVTRR